MSRSHHTAVALVLALCCVLAGCNTFASGQSSAQGTAPPVTPADVPQDLSGGTIAPGLTEQGIVDASALYEAHQRVLADESVSLGIRFEERSGDTLSYGASATYRYGPNRTRTAFDANITAGSRVVYDRSSRWSNATTRYSRTVVGDTTTYERQTVRAGQSSTQEYQYRSERLRRLLDSMHVQDVRYVGDDDERVYRVQGVTNEGSRVCADGGGTRQVPNEVDLVVDERGVVRGFAVHQSHCRSTADGQVTMTTLRETTYENVGTTTLSAPEWVDDAREQIADREYVAPGVTTDRVVDSRALQLAHRNIVRNATGTQYFEQGHVVDGQRNTSVVERSTAGTDGRYVSRQTYTDGQTETTWANESVSYHRQVADETTRYYGVGEMRTSLRSQHGVSSMLLYAEETTVTALGDGRYRVDADGLPTTRYRYQDTDGDDAENDGHVSFVVNESGFVSELERERVLRYDQDSGTVRRYTVVRYSEMGEATVDRPDWLDEAANETENR